MFVEILHSPKGENALTIIQESKTRNNFTEEEIKSTDDKTINILTESIDMTDGSKDQDNEPNISELNVIVESIDFGGVLGGMGSTANGFGTNTSTNMPVNTEPASKDHRPSNPSDVGDKFKSKFDSYDPTNSSKCQLKDIFINIHEPRYIIKLETERFRTCLGYLVFPKIDPASLSMGSMSSTAGAIDNLCMTILGQIGKKLKLPTGDSITVDADLKGVIAQYIQSLTSQDDLRVRYVAPELMVHWNINVDKYYPYGESIFDVVKFDCNLLMALKTATTIKRLTNAIDKRFINIETGLPNDAKNLVEMVREGMRKKKISVDNFGSIDSIPSLIPVFEDIYLPMRDGKKFVEFDHQQWGSNAQDDIEPLKFMRDNIVANLGVPAPFIGLEENTSNRALLSVENIMFARTIIRYQKELSVHLKQLFEKIYILVYNESVELLDTIKITFSEPKASSYEHEMEYVEQMQRLIEVYKGLGIPELYLKKKYLPGIDWKEIEAFQAEETLKKELGTNGEGEEDDGMGGMGGGGMSGF
jgi:hypothetical protein